VVIFGQSLFNISPNLRLVFLFIRKELNWFFHSLFLSELKLVMDNYVVCGQDYLETRERLRDNFFKNDLQNLKQLINKEVRQGEDIFSPFLHHD
jgi:hypothetical protein